VPGLSIIGTAAPKASVLSLVIAGLETLSLGATLNEYGIATRAGHHCAQPIVRYFGHESTLRASLAFYNTRDEVDFFVSTLRQLAAANIRR
jgi:cysteine desulfurase / selenocysteine lyase